MKISRLAIAFLFLVAFFVGTRAVALAQQVAQAAAGLPKFTEEEAAKLNAAGTPPKALPSKQLKAARDNFLKEMNMNLGDNPGGKIMIWGEAGVSEKSTSPQWGKYRELGFERALADAQTKFVQKVYGRIAAEQIKKLKEDLSSNAEVFPESADERTKVGALFDKLIALGDAELNKKLQEMNIDSKKFDALPPAQKKDLFCREFTKSMITTAIGNTDGMMPIQTFEGNDDKGNYAIGVLLMYADSFKQLAYDVANYRKPFMPKSKIGKPIREAVITPPEVLVNQFGVRCLFNENGEPVIVSFGQWAISYTGDNERVRQRHVESANKTAIDQANANIAFFLSGRLMMERKKDIGERVEEFLIKKPDGFIERHDDVNTLIDKTNELTRQQAKADLAGISTLHDWEYDHPNGQKIIGVIQVWSYDSAQNTNKVRTWQPNSGNSGNSAPEAEPKTTPGVKQGEKYMNPADF